jgi:hypothetical protein
VSPKVVISLEDGRLYSDLSFEMCDHALTVSGEMRPHRASGEVRRSTIGGALLVLRFVATRANYRAQTDFNAQLKVW